MNIVYSVLALCIAFSCTEDILDKDNKSNNIHVVHTLGVKGSQVSLNLRLSSNDVFRDSIRLIFKSKSNIISDFGDTDLINRIISIPIRYNYEITFDSLSKNSLYLIENGKLVLKTLDTSYQLNFDKEYIIKLNGRNFKRQYLGVLHSYRLTGETAVFYNYSNKLPKSLNQIDDSEPLKLSLDTTKGSLLYKYIKSIYPDNVW